jgi:hypothetical protein
MVHALKGPWQAFVSNAHALQGLLGACLTVAHTLKALVRCMCNYDLYHSMIFGGAFDHGTTLAGALRNHFDHVCMPCKIVCEHA